MRVFLRRMKARRSRRGQGGFTIIEVMIAMLIFVIGATGLIAMQLVTMRSSQFTKHATSAVTIAEDHMEEMMAMPATGITSGWDYVDSLGNVVPYGQHDFYRSTNVSTNGNAVKIEIWMYWYERGSEWRQFVMRGQRSVTF